MQDELVSILFGHLNELLTLTEIAFGNDQSPEFLADIRLNQSPVKLIIVLNTLLH